MSTCVPIRLDDGSVILVTVKKPPTPDELAAMKEYFEWLRKGRKG